MFKKIERDKWKHFYVGILIGLVLQSIAFWLLPQYLIGASIAVFTVVVAISYGFELYSKISGRGHYEIADAIASIIGGIIGIAVSFAIAFFS